MINFLWKSCKKNGYEIDYKKIVDIYKASRNSDGFKKRQLKKEKEATEIQKHIEKYY